MGKRVFLSILIVSFGTLLIGCNGSTTVETPDGNTATVTPGADGDSVTVTGPNGEQSKIAADDAGMELPKDFPKDIPIPPGTKVITTTKMGPVDSVTLQTKAPVADVISFYNQAVVAKGWDVVASFNKPTGSMIGTTKGNRSLNITVFRTDDVTTISLNVSVAPKL